MNRLLFLVTLASALLLSSTAFAGPYLNTAAMLMREGFQSSEMLRINLGEREFARSVHRMAEARVDLATHMVVPKEVERAHPHFLLVLTQLERAADAATRGEVAIFVRSLDAARSESRTLKSILDQAHLSLPSLRECSAATSDPAPQRTTEPEPARPAQAPTTSPQQSPRRASLPQPPRRVLGRPGHRLAVDPARLAPRRDLST